MRSVAGIGRPADIESMAIENCLCSFCLSSQPRPFGNATVPFDQRRHGSTSRDHVLEKCPDQVSDLPIVAVDQQGIAFVVCLLGMAGQMDLAHMAQWEVGQIVYGGVTLVRCGYEDVVDVEQQSAPAAPDKRAKKVHLGHRGFAEGNVG